MSNYDLNFSNSLREEIAKYNMPLELVANIAEIPLSTLNNKLQNNTPWRVKEAAKLSEYLGASLDKMIIGLDMRQRKKRTTENLKQELKDFLIKNKKYKTLGRLTAEGYLDK